MSDDLGPHRLGAWAEHGGRMGCAGILGAWAEDGGRMGSAGILGAWTEHGGCMGNACYNGRMDGTWLESTDTLSLSSSSSFSPPGSRRATLTRKAGPSPGASATCAWAPWRSTRVGWCAPQMAPTPSTAPATLGTSSWPRWVMSFGVLHEGVQGGCPCVCLSGPGAPLVSARLRTCFDIPWLALPPPPLALFPRVPSTAHVPLSLLLALVLSPQFSPCTIPASSRLSSASCAVSATIPRHYWWTR